MTTITPLALAEVLLITPKRHGDARGWFAETWSRQALGQAGVDADFVQDNQAFNARAGTAAYAQFMEGVEELSQINAELLRRGDPLQAR